jgi:diaminopimelate epimerase
MHFIKAHACGNDFLIVEEPVDESQRSTIARHLCERHTGIGADGVEYLSLGNNGAFAIRLFNADGSEGEISGNGTRCVAAYLAQQEDSDSISIRTHAGMRHCRILKRDPPRYRIAMEMGVPRVAEKSIVLQDGTVVAGLDVFVGNPHYVVFVDEQNFDCFGRRWQKVGEEICTHPDFPSGTNVEFVRMKDIDTIEFRIFERGVGPTQSSGTGTCASAAASIHALGAARRLTVISEGGEQFVEWPVDNVDLTLIGPAEIVAEGEFLLA